MKYGFLNDVSQVDFKLPESSPFNKGFIKPDQKNKLQIYVGCSVWSDKDYVGKFYPEKTPQKNFLKEYAKQFSTVEVNATRYGIPAPKTMNTWKEAVGDDFRLSFKVPQIISQRKDLLSKDVLERLNQYVLAIDTMKQKAGTSFLLLQNNFSAKRLTELEKFIQYLPVEQEYAFEIRNPELNQTSELGSLLNQYNIAHVITDTAGRRDVIHQMITNNTAYIRFVGNGLITTDYERIDKWVRKLDEWIKKGLNKIYFMIHQPDQLRSFSAILVKYTIEQINKRHPDLNLKAPDNLSDKGQSKLF
jgi:uncharacterized protein YecE (DUF72 family)